MCEAAVWEEGLLLLLPWLPLPLLPLVEVEVLEVECQTLTGMPRMCEAAY